MASFFKHGILKSVRQKSGIDTLDSREQKVLSGGIVFILCFFVFQFVLTPFWDSRTNIIRSIEKKREGLVKIIRLEKEYSLLKSETGGVRKKLLERSPGFTLFTFLDRQTTIANVKKHIKYMKPSTSASNDKLGRSMVEMKLQKITLKLLVDFIRLVESEENVVSISRISIQEGGNEQGYLDVILQVMTFELKES